MKLSYSFNYSDVKQFQSLYKELAKKQGFTMSEISKKLGYTTPQQLTNKFNNKKLSFDDAEMLLSAIGCKLEISFVIPDTESRD